MAASDPEPVHEPSSITAGADRMSHESLGEILTQVMT
jgi:hypothetical protein